MPYNNQMNNRAVRQIVKVSIGGKTIRLKLSNELSTTPVEIESVYIAQAENGSDIRKGKVGYLKFSGKDGVTLPAGKAIYSDELQFETTTAKQNSQLP